MKKDDVIETFNLLQTDENTKKFFDADISARIPYRLHCCVYNFNREVWVEDDVLYNYDLGGNCQTLKILNECGACLMYYQIRPYLRPLSSMTEKEIKEHKHLIAFSGSPDGAANLVDWLNKKMFAYRTIDGKDMFKLGLALEAPNDMYKEK